MLTRFLELVEQFLPVCKGHLVCAVQLDTVDKEGRCSKDASRASVLEGSPRSVPPLVGVHDLVEELEGDVARGNKGIVKEAEVVSSGDVEEGLIGVLVLMDKDARDKLLVARWCVPLDHL